MLHVWNICYIWVIFRANVGKCSITMEHRFIKQKSASINMDPFGPEHCKKRNQLRRGPNAIPGKLQGQAVCPAMKEDIWLVVEPL